MTETLERSYASQSERRARKYGNRRVMVDEHTFDSLLEARRYQALWLLAVAGEIRDLHVHPRYPLVVNGQRIGHYTADFEYIDRDGQRVVEDCKSGPTKTQAYRLRKKLFEALYGLTVREIEEA